MHRQIDRPRHRFSGFTLVELLVSLTIIGLLIAMTLPAIQQSRASARRMQCASHLRQIGIATHAYTESNAQLPWLFDEGLLLTLLPYLEQKAEHDRLLELLVSGNMSDNIQAIQTAAKFEFYVCPDDTWAILPGAASYSLNVGLISGTGQQNGFIPIFDQVLSWRDVTDGLSQTVFCSEMRSAPEISPMLPPDPRYAAWYVSSSLRRGLTRDQLAQLRGDRRLPTRPSTRCRPARPPPRRSR